MKKQIRKRTRRKKKSNMELDITSLLDILVVILIFLLKSYSTSNVIINVPKEIKLPRSASQEINQEGVTLQVSAEKVFVDAQVVIDMNKEEPVFDDSGKKLVPLFNELVRKRESTENLYKTVQGAKPFSGIVNLVMDKNVKYAFLKKLMYTCGEAGYIKFKFVVLGES